MDVKGAQALANRIDEVGEPEVRYLVNAVTFLIHQRTASGTFDVVAMGSVDRYGHISLRAGQPHHAASLEEHRERVRDRSEEMTETLLDNELAEWRAVGDGDSELYATPALMSRLEPSLAALPDGWQQWS